jgi:hypothetical protein
MEQCLASHAAENAAIIIKRSSLRDTDDIPAANVAMHGMINGSNPCQ